MWWSDPIQFKICLVVKLCRQDHEYTTIFHFRLSSREITDMFPELTKTSMLVFLKHCLTLFCHDLLLLCLTAGLTLEYTFFYIFAQIFCRTHRELQRNIARSFEKHVDWWQMVDIYIYRYVCVCVWEEFRNVYLLMTWV